MKAKEESSAACSPCPPSPPRSACHAVLFPSASLPLDTATTHCTPRISVYLYLIYYTLHHASPPCYSSRCMFLPSHPLFTACVSQGWLALLSSMFVNTENRSCCFEQEDIRFIGSLKEGWGIHSDCTIIIAHTHSMLSLLLFASLAPSPPLPPARPFYRLCPGSIPQRTKVLQAKRAGALANKANSALTFTGTDETFFLSLPGTTLIWLVDFRLSLSLARSLVCPPTFHRRLQLYSNNLHICSLLQCPLLALLHQSIQSINQTIKWLCNTFLINDLYFSKSHFSQIRLHPYMQPYHHFFYSSRSHIYDGNYITLWNYTKSILFSPCKTE